MTLRAVAVANACTASAETRADVTAVLHDYFDGLHFGDTQRLRRVFHPQAVYATATDEPVLILNMDDYFAVVDRRPSPASRGDARTDRIESLELVGPATAWAKVRCSILPKHYTDLLTLIHADGRWQIIAKVFHHEVHP